MEFSENYESFGNFNNDPFCNLLDEEIPQNIFDELMNDVNYQALGFDMNSVSSEDSGRSSSSYDLGPRLGDTFGDQTMLEVPQIPAENIKSETIEDDPNSPMSYMCTTNSPPSRMNASPIAATVTTAVPIVVAAATASPVAAGNVSCTERIISQPILTTTQQTITQIQQQQQQQPPQPQPQFILSQPQKIVVKQEPITFHTQPNVQQHQQHQQIFTLQSIGGQQFVVTNANQTPVHTIVNGATGILTKIPVVPVTSIIQQPITATPKRAHTLAPTTMTTVALQPTKVTVKPNTPPAPTVAPSAITSTMATKPSKKSGHNIIERRYRTSIVSTNSRQITKTKKKLKFFIVFISE